MDRIEVTPIEWKLCQELTWDPPPIECVLCGPHRGASFFLDIRTQSGPVRHVKLALCADHTALLQARAPREIIDAVVGRFWASDRSEASKAWARLEAAFKRRLKKRHRVAEEGAAHGG